jgi:molecular chaperone GrpE (heat shock protein)
MGGRGSAAGLNKGGGAETRQLTSLANAPASDFTKNKMMSKTNPNTPASEAQIKKITKMAEDKKTILKRIVKEYRDNKKRIEASGGEVKGTLTQKLKKTLGIMYNTDNIRNTIRNINKAKRSKFANETIDLLNKR